MHRYRGGKEEKYLFSYPCLNYYVEDSTTSDLPFYPALA